MKIDARLTFNQVRHDQDNKAHLVLSLNAPSLDTSGPRPKLSIIVCVDTSSSMAGQKIEYAKMSLLKMIDHLKADDYFGIVSFDNSARVVAPLSSISNGKDTLRKLVGGLRPSGSTNFADGMLKAIDMLKNEDLGSNYIQRVIMFTDGQANVGPAKTAPELIQLFKANAPDFISASAFGYGLGQGDFDPEFLSSFAKEGRGNYAHVEDPDKALKAFGTELGGLASTYATGLSIQVTPLAGHRVEQVVSDVDAEEEITGEVQIQVPDILSEETRHIVMAVKLAEQKVPGPRSVNVFDVRVTYNTFDSVGKKEINSIDAKAKVQFVKAGEEQKKPTEVLDDIVGLAQLVRAQLEAEEQAKKGNFEAASLKLQGLGENLTQRGRSRLAAAASNLQGRMDSRASYSVNEGYLRSFSRGATRGMGVSSYSGGADQELQALGVSTSNTTQLSTADSFTQSIQGQVSVPPVVSDLLQVQNPQPLVWHGIIPPTSVSDQISLSSGTGVISSGAILMPVDPPVIPVEASAKVEEKPKEKKVKRVRQSKSKDRW